MHMNWLRINRKLGPLKNILVRLKMFKVFLKCGSMKKHYYFKCVDKMFNVKFIIACTFPHCSCVASFFALLHKIRGTS